MEEEKEDKKVNWDQVWPGTSVRLITEEHELQGNDIVVGTHFKGELGIGAGTEEYQGAGWQVQEADARTQVQVQDYGGRELRGHDIIVGLNFKDVTGGVTGQEQEGARADIQARLRRAPEVIEPDT